MLSVISTAHHSFAGRLVTSSESRTNVDINRRRPLGGLNKDPSAEHLACPWHIEASSTFQYDCYHYYKEKRYFLVIMFFLGHVLKISLLDKLLQTAKTQQFPFKPEDEPCLPN